MSGLSEQERDGRMAAISDQAIRIAEDVWTEDEPTLAEYELTERIVAATREEAATTERDRVLALVEAAVTPWTETARDNLLAAIKEARRCVITAQEESPHG